jgi:two-component system LytT family response regulator
MTTLLLNYLEVVMGMMRVLICDDNLFTRKMLHEIIVENPFVDEIIMAEDGKKAVEIVKSTFVDIILMDIDMPNLNGMGAGKIIRELSPKTKIIFITGYEDYAVDCFEISPYDYILKPLDIERVQKDITEIAIAVDSDRLNNVLQFSNKVIIKFGNDIDVIDLDDIIFIEKQNKYTILHTKNEIYKTYETLQSIEKRLNNCFYRVHRSYIVNVKEMKKIVPYGYNSYNIQFRDYEGFALMSKEKYSNLIHCLE